MYGFDEISRMERVGRDAESSMEERTKTRHPLNSRDYNRGDLGMLSCP